MIGISNRSHNKDQEFNVVYSTDYDLVNDFDVFRDFPSNARVLNTKEFYLLDGKNFATGCFIRVFSKNYEIDSKPYSFDYFPGNLKAKRSFPVMTILK